MVKGGERMVIAAVTDGNPAPLSTWTFNNQSLEGIAEITIDRRDSLTTLTINEMRPEHAGDYRLVVENVVGSTDAVFKVEVKGQPHFMFL